MSCSRYRQLISRYVDEEVTPRQRQELLAHVHVCAACAAWLARARHTDVLLKGIGNTHPSDRVRNAILDQVRAQTTHHPCSVFRVPHFLRTRVSRFTFRVSRFDPSPKRIALGVMASFLMLIGLAYWLNLLPPIWSYQKLGFEYAPDAGSGQAVVGVGATPVQIPVLSSGQGGGGGIMAAPNLVRITPADHAQAVPLDTPMRVRFDQPMDRASVESALNIVPPAAGAFSWDADNEVQFAPASPGLLRGVTYTVTLTDTAFSLAGTPLRKGTSWAFRTLEPHSAIPDVPDGASLAPTSTLSLLFDAPMQGDTISESVSFRAVDSAIDVPISLRLSDGGRRLLVTPLTSLLEGYVYLRVGATARTESGDTLGKPFEFKYRVQAPSPSLQFMGGRVSLARQGADIPVRYTSRGMDRDSLGGVAVDVYVLPAEMLSALGAQSRQWPSALPTGFPATLQHIQSVQITSLQVELAGLPAGIYLLTATQYPIPNTQYPIPNTSITDWQMVIVSDRNITLTGGNSPIWATSEAGRAWVGAEISLYAPTGALLEKGLTSTAGLWLPSAAAAAAGASVAIARDLDGHVAATLIDKSISWQKEAAGALEADLITDLPDYRPGQTVNFRALLHAGEDGAPATPTIEQDVSASLLMPGASGAPLSQLTLKPDSVGGVSGLFPLSPDIRPGVYTIRVYSAGAHRDFPLSVTAGKVEGLSVYIEPDAATQISSTSITRTVSVLGSLGAPTTGALITGTLRILGDSWASEAVTGTTGSDGRATIVMPLPGWYEQYNEPGLYLEVEARQQDARGSDVSYLDYTSPHNALSGMTQLVAPDYNVAVVARPAPDAAYRVRLVLVDQTAPVGDILALAEAPSGERLNYSLDMARLLDATLNIPQRFAGGTLVIKAAGKAGSRTLALMPAEFADSAANLRVITPFSVTAGSDLPVKLALTSADSMGMVGTATLWLRRVSGAPQQRPEGWQPAISITQTGSVTTTMQTPNTPGLWYVMAEAATPFGNKAQAWGVVRVLPGPWMQLPPEGRTQEGSEQPLEIVVHNPGADPFTGDISAQGEGTARVVGASTQPVDVPAGSWERFYWRVASAQAGAGGVVFSFAPGSGSDSGIGGNWSLRLPAVANAQADTTYTAGALTGERDVGVAVPSGLSNDGVKLEVRASTSLLPALASIVTDLPDGWTQATEGVSLAAVRLSAPASVASAYASLNASPPGGLLLSGVERSSLLQQLYSAQREDGSWSYDLAGDAGSSVRQTAIALLAMHRAGTYTQGNTSQIEFDKGIINKALDYLMSEVSRPLPENNASNALDERAFGLYVLSLYRTVPPEWVRPLMAYAGDGTNDKGGMGNGDGNSNGGGLSRDGQAWLALALWQSSNAADAVAIIDRLLITQPRTGAEPSAPMLESLALAGQAISSGRARTTGLSDYLTAARSYANALMEARQGVGWRTPEATADALWALSRYAIATGEKPKPGEGAPTITLGDHPIEADSAPGNPSSLLAVLGGDQLRPGTNWLKLRASTPTQSLYYSLTLRVTK